MSQVSENISKSWADIPIFFRGHRKQDCTNERVMICRNCDEKGHTGRECPKVSGGFIAAEIENLLTISSPAIIAGLNVQIAARHVSPLLV
jgi:hypothetical protein